jgi:D-alanine-D-alanine ligase
MELQNSMKIRGMSRTDVRIHEGEIYILDINTMPNLDVRSFLPSIAMNDGIDLKELFRRILLRTNHYKMVEKVFHFEATNAK